MGEGAIQGCNKSCEYVMVREKHMGEAWIDAPKERCTYTCKYEDGSSAQVSWFTYAGFKISSLFSHKPESKGS